MKRILFLTGTRADFGKIKRLMNYVEQDERYELHVAVTGMHMLKLYGGTYREVKREGYRNQYLFVNQHADEPMDSILGNTVSQLSRLVHEIEPDLVVVHGDRVEAMAGAIVGALNNRLVCHIEGGELSGTIDDLIRHSVSKLSHVHMVANDEARDRLLQMGENPRSIFVIGSPDLDVMASDDLPALPGIRAHYGISAERYAIVMFHPVTTEVDQIPAQVEELKAALAASNDHYIVVYPNNDLGSHHILEAWEHLRGESRFQVFPSIRFESFLVLLQNADYIIGNSSAGIREAPFFGTPTINIGSRQNRRFKTGSIIDCACSRGAILGAIEQARVLPRQDSPAGHHFGDGDSVSRFAQVLAEPDFWATPLQKQFMDRA